MHTLGKTIRLLRHQNGWSQEQTAHLLAISIPVFSKIETGVTDISFSRLKQIAAVFNLSVVALLTYEFAQEKQAGALDRANRRLKAREEEIIQLQRKVIELFNELHVPENNAPQFVN